ncbi:RDD family protein [Flavobacterium aquariorum]|uniref:RDD family protein n=1 Tax=Flavobacterium aquariorum TaxID=2217670 RepID=A0A2W7VP95_9FLAO|nr:RDD family protein [Flavobacterium aquariorum]PZX93942.1 RDD family protein [Flavobacterium aquariorum]
MEHKKFTITDDLLASQGQRLANLIIDLVVQYIIWISIGETIFILADVASGSFLKTWISTMGILEKGITFAIISGFYYYLTELYFSRSMAKFLTKTYIIMKDGSKPNYKSILKRTLCRFIPFEIFSFLGGTAVGWHDSMSETYVVKKQEFEKQKKIIILP